MRFGKFEFLFVLSDVSQIVDETSLIPVISCIGEQVIALFVIFSRQIVLTLYTRDLAQVIQRKTQKPVLFERPRFGLGLLMQNTRLLRVAQTQFHISKMHDR